MENILIFFGLLISSIFVYSWSYQILWFKIDMLFDFISPPSKSDKILDIQRWDTDDSSFFYKFYAEYSVPSHKILKSIRVLFSMAMVCYVTTIEIILWQIIAAEAEQKSDFITNWVWPFMSFSLMTLLILIQPFLILISLLDKFFNDKFNVKNLAMITAAIVFTSILVLNFLSFGPFMYTENLLTKLSISGVFVSAVLSAIATVSTLYYAFSMFWSNGRFSILQIRNITTNSARVLLWATDSSVREKITDYEYNIEENLDILRKLEKDQEGTDFLSRDQLIEKIGWYQLEVGKLEKKMRESSYIRNAKKLFNLIFLIYCCHKLIITFVSRIPYLIMHAIQYPDDYQYEYFDIDNKSNFGSDPLAVTLANTLNFVLFHFNCDQDIASLAKQISLLLSTSLFAASLSTVVTTISYLSALLPIRFQILAMFAMQSKASFPKMSTSTGVIRNKKFKKSPSMIKNLFVSELTGIYVVATMLTIRSNLPYEVSQKLNELLGKKFSVPNVVIDAWFYEVFAIFCVVTFLSIKIAEKTLFDRMSNEKANY